MSPDDVLHERATAVRRAALLIERLPLDEVVRAASATTWVGPVAVRFTERVGHHRRILDHLVEELVAVARRLEHSA